MRDALAFVISALLDLYVVALVLRLVLGMTHADFRNPLAQAILKATNPLVLPARRVIPAARSLDTGTLVVLLVVQILGTGLLVLISCAGPASAGQVIGLGLVRLVHLVLRTYSLLTLIYVITSWVSPGGYNPAVAMLASVVEPVLAPFRRIIPSLGGLDLSPVFALLAIEFVNRLVPGGFGLVGLACVPF